MWPIVVVLVAIGFCVPCCCCCFHRRHAPKLPVPAATPRPGTSTAATAAAPAGAAAATAAATAPVTDAPPANVRSPRNPADDWSTAEVACFLRNLGQSSINDGFHDGNNIAAACAAASAEGRHHGVWSRAADFAESERIDGQMLVANAHGADELVQLFAGLQPPLPLTAARTMCSSLRTKFLAQDPALGGGAAAATPLHEGAEGAAGANADTGNALAAVAEVETLRRQLAQAAAALGNAQTRLQACEKEHAAALACAAESAEKAQRQSAARIEALEAELKTSRESIAAAATAGTAGEAAKAGEDSDTAVDRLLKDFCCPITMEVFTDPVRTPEGHVFEREAIESWVDSNGTHPLTRGALAKEDLARDEAVCAQIRALEEAVLQNAASRFMRGDEVVVQRLVKKTKYNGRRGTLQSWRKGRWDVLLPGGITKHLRKQNLNRAAAPRRHGGGSDGGGSSTAAAASSSPRQRSSNLQQPLPPSFLPSSSRTGRTGASARHTRFALRPDVDEAMAELSRSMAERHVATGGGGGGGSGGGRTVRSRADTDDLQLESEWPAGSLQECLDALEATARRSGGSGASGSDGAGGGDGAAAGGGDAGARADPAAARSLVTAQRRAQAVAAVEGAIGGPLPFRFECPRGHALEAFTTPNSGYTCNECARHVPRDCAMHGCQQCDFDLCLVCTHRVAAERRALAQQFS